MSKDWAIPTWVFLHTWAEQMTPAFYAPRSREILELVKGICASLPCPSCMEHATAHMKTVTRDSVKTVEDFRRMLWHFHNQVNARTRKPIFPRSQLAVYRRLNMRVILQVFVTQMTKPLHNKMMTDAMHRLAMIRRVNRWVLREWPVLMREAYQVRANAEAGAGSGSNAHARNVSVQNGEGGGGGQGNQGNFVHT